MDNSIKIALVAICAFSLTAFLYLTVCSCNISAFNSVYNSDKNNDGKIDAVYHYTYDFNSNKIKVDIDSDNDGRINKSSFYDLGSEMPNKLFAKTARGG